MGGPPPLHPEKGRRKAGKTRGPPDDGGVGWHEEGRGEAGAARSHGAGCRGGSDDCRRVDLFRYCFSVEERVGPRAPNLVTSGAGACHLVGGLLVETAGPRGLRPDWRGEPTNQGTPAELCGGPSTAIIALGQV